MFVLKQQCKRRGEKAKTDLVTGYGHIFCLCSITCKYMLHKQRQKGVNMHRFTKPVVSLRIFVALLAIVVGTTLLATSNVRPALAATAQTYIVLYKAQAVTSDAANTISQAGGTLVYSYPQIGVVIASSNNTAFRDNLMTDSQIDSASATTNFGTRIDDGTVKGESATDVQ